MSKSCDIFENPPFYEPQYHIADNQLMDMLINEFRGRFDDEPHFILQYCDFYNRAR